MNTTPIISESLPKSVVAAIGHILRPLVHLLISHGMGYPAFQELLKLTYVKVAEEQFKLENKAQTDSRINLLTGLYRRDIKRLRTIGNDFENSIVQHVGLSVQIISLWVGDDRYLDENGKPKPLSRLSGKNGVVSFNDLVASVNMDIRPRAVLDDWLHIGVAHLDSEGYVCLNTDAFIPSKGLDEKAFYFAMNVHDHIAAAAQNVMNLNQKPFFERSLYYDELSEDSIAELAKMAEEHSMRTLHAMNRRAIKLAKKDQDRPDARFRMNFGVYYFNAEGSSIKIKGNDQS